MARYGKLIRKASSSAKPAILHFVGREPEKGIVFHHIPKCGGVSISSALGAAYAPWLVKNVDAAGTVAAARLLAGNGVEDPADFPWDEIHRLRVQLLAMHLADGARCVTGHVQFSEAVFERFSASHSFVTVLRDPVERFVSQFIYSTRSSDSYDRRDIAWNEAELARVGPRWGRTQASFLAGEGAQGATEAELVEAAKRTLRRLHVIGFLDDLGGFGEEVRHATGAALSFPVENRSPKSETARLRDDPLIERVRAYCAPDLEVYACARQLYGYPRADAGVPRPEPVS